MDFKNICANCNKKFFYGRIIGCQNLCESCAYDDYIKFQENRKRVSEKNIFLFFIELFFAVFQIIMEMLQIFHLKLIMLLEYLNYKSH